MTIKVTVQSNEGKQSCCAFTFDDMISFNILRVGGWGKVHYVLKCQCTTIWFTETQLINQLLL